MNRVGRDWDMPRYFLDTRDDHRFIEDEDGYELPSVEAAREIAAASLAELAKDAVPT